MGYYCEYLELIENNDACAVIRWMHCSGMVVWDVCLFWTINWHVVCSESGRMDKGMLIVVDGKQEYVG